MTEHPQPPTWVPFGQLKGEIFLSGADLLDLEPSNKTPVLFVGGPNRGQRKMLPAEATMTRLSFKVPTSQGLTHKETYYHLVETINTPEGELKIFAPKHVGDLTPAYAGMLHQALSQHGLTKV